MKKGCWAPLLGHNLLNTILLTRKRVEVFLQQPYILLKISHLGSLFGVANIIDNQYIVYIISYFLIASLIKRSLKQLPL